MVEIEVKIEIKNPALLHERLIAQGARLEKPRYLEENTLYDTSEQHLYKKRQALRLRRVHKKYYLTFKGAPQKSRKFKVREEFETEVKNGKHFQKILQVLGLAPAFHYTKYRTLYRIKKLKICLDETAVGNFLELEGERNEIVRFARALGFAKSEFITLDYVQLIKERGSTP